MTCHIMILLILSILFGLASTAILACAAAAACANRRWPGISDVIHLPLPAARASSPKPRPDTHPPPGAPLLSTAMRLRQRILK